jgi:hypothetical protein
MCNGEMALLVSDLSLRGETSTVLAIGQVKPKKINDGGN